MSTLSEEKKRAIAEDLLGSCANPDEFMDAYGVDDDLDICLAASEYGVENCEICGWWTDEWTDQYGGIVCNNCAENDAE